jgi:predicted esterase
LHGLYQPDAMRDELDRQARVAKHAVARGYAVLALYGRLGICDTRGDHLDWICWPSNEQVASRAAEVVASWKTPLALARQRTGNGRTYVLGFSNGAYFAGLLAVRDLFPADAFVIAQGGPVEPVHALGHRSPILLLTTDEQAPQVHAEMDRFAAELAADDWSFVQEERSGGHELNDQDVDAALDFFDVPSHDALH